MTVLAFVSFLNAFAQQSLRSSSSQHTAYLLLEQAGESYFSAQKSLACTERTLSLSSVPCRMKHLRGRITTARSSVVLSTGTA